MAHMKLESALLFLLLMVIQTLSLVNICPPKCSCTNKNKVDCRGRGLTEVYDSDKFPSTMLRLDLSRNNISVIRKGFLGRHRQLKKLFLQKNSINVIEERAFVGLTNLQRLVVKHNNLGELNASSFLGLLNLESLDLSVNKIRNIDKLAFHGVSSLTRLVLSNNSFKAIKNGTFNSLKKLRRIKLENVPLICDCHLNSFVKYLTSSPTLKVEGTCYHSKFRFSALRGEDLCVDPPKLHISPKINQVVALGDSFRIECGAIKQPSLHLDWTKNGKVIRKEFNVKVAERTVSDEIVTTIEVRYATKRDAGDYVCSHDRVVGKKKKVTVKVVSSSLKMCARESMKTDRGHLLWPVAFSGTTEKIPCPSYGNEENEDTKVQRTCSQDGRWSKVDYGNCHWVSLSDSLTKLRNLILQKKLIDVTTTLRKLTNPSNFRNCQDISRVLNVVDGVISKQEDEPFNEKVLDNLLATFSNIMDVDSGILYDAQRSDQSPSKLAGRLELISRRILSQGFSRVMSNIVIGSVVLRKKDFEGKTCYVFFKTETPSRPSGVWCQPPKRKDFVVSIHIPKTIFENLRTAGVNKESLVVQFLVYRNANLFPNVISNDTEASMQRRNVSSSVLAIQLASIKELNLTEPVVISFGTKAGTDPVITHFDFGEKVVGRLWSPDKDCHVNEATSSLTIVNCAKLVNKNLAVMSVLGSEPVVVYSMEVIVYFGAVITSLFLLATLITFAAFRNLRFDRDDVLMLMNACLALLVLVVTFTFGIIETKSNVVCLMVGILLHFFFLASLFWLGSYILCISRRLKQPKESEEVFNPVLRYYMVSWGIPAIICGITLAGNLSNYTTSEYCWLIESAGLGAFVGPACLLFIVICVLLVRLHLLLSRGVINRRHSEEDSEEERLHTDEPGVLEPTPEPGQHFAAMKSAAAKYLVATWVVMSLIYINFLVAYLLVKYRKVKLWWKLLSYVYALTNIALGASVFSLYCVARSDVRESWRKVWKRVKTFRINCGPWRTLWISRRMFDTKRQRQVNGRVSGEGEEMNVAKGESDRQSNITLPSSAALTNDVFVNGRPLSTARVSLLEEEDFSPEGTTHGGAVANEVDITDVANSEASHRRSQSSMHSDRRSTGRVDSQIVSKAPTENVSVPQEKQTASGNFFSPEANEETNTDITDGVTSKSESSAPTAIEMPLLQTSTPLDNSSQECPRTFSRPPASMDTPASPSSSSLSEAAVKVLNFKRKRSSESLNSRNGSVGPRARKLVQLQPNAYPSSSSTFSEIPPQNTDAKGHRPNETINARGPAPNAGPNKPAQRPVNRYKNGREKPQPKEWTVNPGSKIAYVPVPHVSKIHRQPTRNETSV